MNLKVIFFCGTCYNYNEMNLSCQGYSYKNYTFEYLNDAIQHIKDNSVDSNHYIEVKIIEDKENEQ